MTYSGQILFYNPVVPKKHLWIRSHFTDYTVLFKKKKKKRSNFSNETLRSFESWPKQNKPPKMYCMLLQFCSEMWTGQTFMFFHCGEKDKNKEPHLCAEFLLAWCFHSLKEFFFLSISKRRSTRLYRTIPIVVLCVFINYNVILIFFFVSEKGPNVSFISRGTIRLGLRSFTIQSAQCFLPSGVQLCSDN